MNVDRRSKRALSTIRGCVEAGRFRVLEHFTHRMDQRGLVWPDVLAVLDSPDSVRDGGLDRFDLPKWIIGGTAADGLALEIVCALDEDERGRLTVFITVY
jgi:hypothetical protein